MTRSRMHTRTLMASAMSLLLTGCVGGIVPSSFSAHTDDGAHKHITAEIVERLKPGQTTMADVLRELGDWNVELADGRIWVYSWATRQEVNFLWGIFFANGYEAGVKGGAFGFDAEQTHFLVLEFDGGGILRAKRTNQGGRLNVNATGVGNVFEP